MPATSAAPPPGACPRILILDDRDGSTPQLASSLGRRGLDVRTVPNGPAGLTEVGRRRPDLILLDGGSGRHALEICARLTADLRAAAVPVIILSHRQAIEDRLDAFSSGAADYIGKPFSDDEVYARISVHLRAKRRIDRLEAMVAERSVGRLGEPAFPDDALYADALAILAESLAEPLGLVDLARRLATNERKLTGLFRRRLGLTVFDYFCELRLETARQLLSGSGLRVQAISAHVGYRNPGDFTRAFRRRYGMSPREFRRRCGEADGQATE